MTEEEVYGELLEDAEKANAQLCSDGWCEARAFVEKWVPKFVTDYENMKGEINLLKRKLALTEAQLLEAEAKVKELEDV